MSKKTIFLKFLNELEDYETIHAVWCAKLIENGRQTLESIYNNIDNEQLMNLMDSFMRFVSLLSLSHPDSYSDEKNTLSPSENSPKQQNESQDLLPKSDIIKMVNNDLQCPICNEWLFRATSANCNHTFCETCIQKWLKINKTCPVCRTSIQYASTSIALDNFISNLCQLFGGFIKERRESIQNSRSDYNNQSNADYTVDEINEISELLEDTSFINDFETTIPTTHPNMVRLMPSPQLQRIPVSRTTSRQPRVSSNILHPNTVQLLPFPRSTIASANVNRLQPTSSTSVISPRVNRLQQTNSAPITSPNVRNFQPTYSNIAVLIPRHNR